MLKIITGYSAFAVVQIDSDNELALTRGEADEIASTISDAEASEHRHMPFEGSDAMQGVEGIESEDHELQAAIQASLMAASGGSYPPSSSFHYAPPMPSSSLPPINSGGSALGRSGSDDLDPVAASAARNQAMLERMLNEQRGAQEELWSDGLGRPRVNAEEEDEAEMIRRAIAESEALAQNPRTDAEGWPTDFNPSSHRVYDDDDEELQAALRASLEEGPSDWKPTESPAPSHPSAASVQPQLNVPSIEATISGSEDTTSNVSEDADVSRAEEAPQPSVDDIRKARLARFGG
jgi:Ataxin-3